MWWRTRLSSIKPRSFRQQYLICGPLRSKSRSNLFCFVLSLHWLKTKLSLYLQRTHGPLVSSTSVSSTAIVFFKKDLCRQELLFWSRRFRRNDEGRCRPPLFFLCILASWLHVQMIHRSFLSLQSSGRAFLGTFHLFTAWDTQLAEMCRKGPLTIWKTRARMKILILSWNASTLESKKTIWLKLLF